MAYKIWLHAADFPRDNKRLMWDAVNSRNANTLSVQNDRGKRTETQCSDDKPFLHNVFKVSFGEELVVKRILYNKLKPGSATLNIKMLFDSEKQEDIFITSFLKIYG